MSAHMYVCVCVCVEENWNVQLAGGWEAMLIYTCCLRSRLK